MTFQQKFIIADIEESLGILGINFLDQYGADVKIKKRILKTKQGKIKLHKRGAQVCNKLQLCETVTIPAKSEAFVKAYMPENCTAKLNLLEPSNKYVNQGLLIARTLIDSSHDQMTISLLNVSDKNIKLRESTTLGIAHPVENVSTYSNESEFHTESECHAESDCHTESKCHTESECCTESENRTESGNFDIPEFLRPLLENVGSELNFSEKQQASSLLKEFQDVLCHLKLS